MRGHVCDSTAQHSAQPQDASTTHRLASLTTATLTPRMPLLLQVWMYNDATHRWQQDGPLLAKHSGWVRDVAWGPNLGLPKNTIASAGQDGKVFMWNEKAEGTSKPLPPSR
jgi:hypothetical protein